MKQSFTTDGGFPAGILRLKIGGYFPLFAPGIDAYGICMCTFYSVYGQRGLLLTSQARKQSVSEILSVTAEHAWSMALNEAVCRNAVTSLGYSSAFVFL